MKEEKYCFRGIEPMTMGTAKSRSVWQPEGSTSNWKRNVLNESPVHGFISRLPVNEEKVKREGIQDIERNQNIYTEMHEKISGTKTSKENNSRDKI